MVDQRFFIQQAIKHKGSLRAFVKKVYGKKGFVKSKATGKMIINARILNKLATMACPVCHKKHCTCSTVKRKAVLARTLRRF